MIREIAIFLIGLILLIIVAAIISNNNKANKISNDNIEDNKETGSQNI